MDNQAYIEFKQERNFGQIINATFTFLSNNMKDLFGLFARYVLPFFVLGFVSAFIGGMGLTRQISSESVGLSFLFMFFMILYMLFLAAGVFMLILVLNSYITLYINLGKDNFTRHDVMGKAKNDLWKMMGIFVVSILMIGVGFMIFIIPGAILITYLSFVFISASYHNLDFGSAISRSFQLVRGNWWMIFGLMITMSVIQTILAQGIELPTLILRQLMKFNQFDLRFYSILERITNYLSVIISLLLSIIPYITAAFMYFNIIEKNEKPGLFERIRQIKKEDEAVIYS